MSQIVQPRVPSPLPRTVKEAQKIAAAAERIAGGRK